jgi:hypothetical protein
MAKLKLAKIVTNSRRRVKLPQREGNFAVFYIFIAEKNPRLDLTAHRAWQRKLFFICRKFYRRFNLKDGQTEFSFSFSRDCLCCSVVFLCSFRSPADKTCRFSQKHKIPSVAVWQLNCVLVSYIM